MTTQEQVKDVVSQVLADKADKGGIKRVVWIGAGGSNGGNYPAQYFMEHEATQVVSSSYTSNEFVHATPAYVNENTLAVVVSMRGTKETIVAAQVAKDHGASTIAYSAPAFTPDLPAFVTLTATDPALLPNLITSTFTAPGALTFTIHPPPSLPLPMHCMLGLSHIHL